MIQTSTTAADTSLLVVFGVASISAIAAIIAAIIAARSAGKAKGAEIEADRLRRLEERVASQKYDLYKPMLDLFGEMLVPNLAAKINQDKMIQEMMNFATWVTIFGSDQAVLAYRNLMQSSFHDAPAPVFVRLYGDFVIAARRDMGDPGTHLDSVEVMAIRVNDIYDTDMHLEMAMPLAEVFAKHDWQAPWLKPHKAE